LGCLLILLGLLLPFQNCASSSYGLKSAAKSRIQTAEEIGKNQIYFFTQDIQVQSDVNEVWVSGHCSRERNDQTLDWHLGGWSGTSKCEQGQFRFQLVRLSELICGVDYDLEVHSSWGESAQVGFQARCQPLATQPVAAPKGSPVGTACDLEYSPWSQGESCLRVCYRESKVVDLDSVEPESCSHMASQLAGQ